MADQLKTYLPETLVIRLKPTGVWQPRINRKQADEVLQLEKYPVDLNLENHFPHGQAATLVALEDYLRAKHLLT